MDEFDIILADDVFGEWRYDEFNSEGWSDNDASAYGLNWLDEDDEE